MTSFFDKLNEKMNGKGRQFTGSKSGGKSTPDAAPDEKKKAQTVAEEIESEKLNVDVYQSTVEVVIYALAAGVDPDDFAVILDEENDMLTIKGTRKRPVKHKKEEAGKEIEGKYVQEECIWMPFSRKIILPLEVDVVKAEAIFKKGVLIITLPILNVTEGRKLRVMETLTTDIAKPKQ